MSLAPMPQHKPQTFDRTEIVSMLPSRLILLITITLVGVIAAGCTASASNQMFFGKTDPPPGNTLRYVSGSEPESIDPQIPDGQNEARICLALYEGLTEYYPKPSEPTPALAERWEFNKDWCEGVFDCRHDAGSSTGNLV